MARQNIDRIISGLTTKEAWNRFVNNVFIRLKTYTAAYTPLTEEIDREIDYLASLAADKVWKEEKGKITDWGLAYVINCVSGLDSGSSGRFYLHEINDFLRRIEGEEIFTKHEALVFKRLASMD